MQNWLLFLFHGMIAVVWAKDEDKSTERRRKGICHKCDSSHCQSLRLSSARLKAEDL